MGGEKVRTEEPEEPCSQRDKISLFPPQTMKQQLVPEGSGLWLGPVLKLLPITCGNQLAKVELNMGALHAQERGATWHHVATCQQF